MGVTQNRTYWPTTGGALAFQPGWFQGHATAFLYVNMGFGTDGPDGGPMNMSLPIVPPFQILGPSKNPYPGTMCLPQVPLPANTVVKAGDNATIQVVELAVHGASLFSVSSGCAAYRCPDALTLHHSASISLSWSPATRVSR
jgi:hypothetical protein